MMALPSPQQLRYLTTLADLRHFGRAAVSCGVTQSTLSAGILALERQLGLAVLDRAAGRRPVLTPAGEEIASRARQALTALESVAEVAVAARAPLHGAFRLGVIPTVAPFLLPRLLPALRENFPGLRLSLSEDVTGQLLEKLGDGRLDLLLLAMPCACEALETLPLTRDPFLAALPPGHRLQAHAQLTLAALGQERLLLLEDGHCLRDQVLSACRQEGGWDAGAEERFAATSLQTLVQMVDHGLGVTLLPRLAVRSGIADGSGLVLRPLAEEGAWRTIGLAWRPRSVRRLEFLSIASLLATLLSDPAVAGEPEQDGVARDRR